MKKKNWYDYLWIWPIIYFALGFFNILFAWLGMIDFMIPMFVAVFAGNKSFCNRYCGRGQLFFVLGGKGKCSRKKLPPKWMTSIWFRRGFMVFFLAMFGVMVWNTYLVSVGSSSLKEVLTLFWTFKLPFGWTYSGSGFPDWVAQFSFGF